MKEYINLLPDQKKEEIREEKRFRVIIGEESSFLFPVVLLIAILFAIQLILGIQGEGIGRAFENNQSQEKYQELKKYEDKFQALNAKIALISKVQGQHLEWAGALVKLSQSVPEEIYITGVATKDYRLFLIGRAKTRDRLLEFQGMLNNSECFAGVNMPLSNLVSKDNVDFQMDFEIKKTCLKDQ